MKALSCTGDRTSGELLARSAAIGISVVLHLAVLAGFLANLRVGLPVPLHADAHPSETETPIIASLVSVASGVSTPADSLASRLEATHLLADLPRIDLPTPMPRWPTEEDSAASSTQPAPAAGRTGLRCEIHIHQSLTGRVQAIDFGECTGDVVWQHTLLRTIQQAAQLVKPTPDAQFPPVRTLTVGTDSLSPTVLAQQLSSTEMFENQKTDATNDPR